MKESGPGFFPRIYYSITSFDKYRSFLRQSTGKAVLYLLLISLFVAIITFIPVVKQFNKFVDEITANFDSKVPDFRFANGRLEVDAEMPIIIDGGSAAIVIDTSPGAEDVILNEYDTVVLITADKIIQKNYVDKSVTDLSVFQGLELTKENFRQTIPLIKPLGVFLFIFTGFFFICGKLISALIASVIGLIINSAKNTGLSYRSIFKISVYSLTLPLLLCTLLDLLPVHMPFLFPPVLFYTVSAVYIYGAIHTIKRELNTL